ncbi:hypothetical protein HPB49_007696 [Dermacentor silvarum]|uniref:Uncharacterized protein n=1 Tax=Dermacentor silvarum TaxID=543639 RepID=A0ACB8DY24_DERSI|nr:hypothetical protein HPB49_007696 [Dermacentor silvarum]
MRKKVENCPPEMMEKRAQSQHKRPRQPSSQASNKKLCRLFDCSHLVVYGETAESVMSHNKWLNENAAIAATDALRPRLLATAQERHERLRSLTISEVLVLFPFLASEASLLLEFDIVFQKNIGDDFAQGCEQLCDIVLKHADDTEVAAFSNVATENPILATFEFVAARCKESLSVVLSEPVGSITQHPEFHTVCRNIAVLRIAYFELRARNDCMGEDIYKSHSDRGTIQLTIVKNPPDHQMLLRMLIRPEVTTRELIKWFLD